ncbi:MAG: transposase, partial [Wolbachia sp.]|nr:transposase [Wolbachia sp.]MDD9335978.1 transposase [Wolbachia sp.]
KLEERLMIKKLTGLLFEDKRYIKMDLFQEILEHNLKLVTHIKKGMKNALMPFNENVLLRKRSIIETVFDYLKNKFKI